MVTAACRRILHRRTVHLPDDLAERAQAKTNEVRQVLGDASLS
jgi:hypothetical protein